MDLKLLCVHLAMLYFSLYYVQSFSAPLGPNTSIFVSALVENVL